MFRPDATKLEALRLYRDIIRATRLFNWEKTPGVKWSDILKDSARKEFEQAKYESNPEVVTRLLFVGRDCLNKTVEQYTTALKKTSPN